jgi:glycerophosphoryl diester phosphodiesterase
MPRRILVASHRGYKAKEIDNTLAGFRRAINEKVDFVEFDVLLTRDSEVVVFHDHRVNPLLNGRGPLKQFTLAELREMRYKDGQVILTLEELLQELKGKIRPLLEIKAAGVEQQVIDLLKQYDLGEEVIVQSFNAQSLRYCYKLWPEIPYALNIGHILNLGLFGEKLKINVIAAKRKYQQLLTDVPATYIHPDGPLVSDSFIQYARAMGKRVILGAKRVWAYVPKLEQWGVEIVNCDDPVYVRQIIKAHWGNTIQCEPPS